MITLTAFRWVPPFAQGVVRDLRVRWALEEAGIPYVQDPAGRSRTTAWVFAAVNSIEPRVQALAELDLFHAKEAWAPLRRPGVVTAVEKRLGDLERWLGERPYLEDRFTAADLMMTTVMRILRGTELISARPVLRDYQQRCEARPAFQKALADLKPFAAPAA